MARRHNVSFYALLALGLSVSAATKYSGTLSIVEPNAARIDLSVATSLGAQGYGLTAIRDSGKYNLHFYAKAGCELVVTQVARGGWEQIWFKDLVPADFGVSFVYRGQVSKASQPVAAPTFDRMIARLAGYVGRPYTAYPVLAIAHSGQCNLLEIDWKPVAEFAVESGDDTPES